MNKKPSLDGDAEFLAELHLQEKEAIYILRQLRNWMQKAEKENYFHYRNMVAYWAKKADALFEGKALNEPIEPKPFKSLMQQLAEGELSYKKEVYESAA